MPKENIAEIVLHAHTIIGECMSVDLKKVLHITGDVEKLAGEIAIIALRILLPSLRTELHNDLEALAVAGKKFVPAMGGMLV